MNYINPKRSRPLDPFQWFPSGTILNDVAPDSTNPAVIPYRTSDSRHSLYGRINDNQKLRGKITQVSSSGQTRAFPAFCVWNNNLVVYSGRSAVSPYTSVGTMQYYNFDSDIWTTIQPNSIYPGNIYAPGCVCVGDYMYMWVGYIDDRTTAKETWKFNFLTRQWTKLQDFPSPGTGYIDYPQACVVGNYIYSFSGSFSGTTNYPTINRFSLLSETWETLTSTVGTAAGWYGGIAFNYNGTIYSVGGTINGAAARSNTDIIPTNPTNGAVRALASTSTSKEYCFGCQLNDFLYVFNNTSGEVYNIKTNVWSSSGVTLPAATYGAAYGFWNGALYYHGGYTSTTTYQTTYRIE